MQTGMRATPSIFKLLLNQLRSPAEPSNRRNHARAEISYPSARNHIAVLESAIIPIEADIKQHEEAIDSADKALAVSILNLSTSATDASGPRRQEPRRWSYLPR